MPIIREEDKLIWGPYYEAVLNILGTTGLIIPMGDSNRSAGDETTVTTVGEEQVVFTYEGTGVDAFATPPTIIGPAHIPLITFNGTDEEVDSPDALFWSPNDAAGPPATADVAFSLGLWINPAAASDDMLIAKWDEGATTREWMYALSGDAKPEFSLYDENANTSEIGEATTAVTLNAMQFVVVTYDGAQAAPDVNFYLNGAADGSGTTETGAYDAGQNTAATVTLAMRKNSGTAADFYSGKMAGGPLGPFFVLAELSADKVKRLYQLGQVALGV